MKQIVTGDAVTMTDIPTLRKRARKNIEEGAVTDGYAADRSVVIDLLNQALATELVCVLRYKRHFFMAKGIHADPVKAEFLVHANEEMGHADRLAKRIIELGGEPDFCPDGLSARSHAEYVTGDTLKSMIKENLIAERIAVESYREMIAYLASKDSTTQQMLKGILASEEAHADDLASFAGGPEGLILFGQAVCRTSFAINKRFQESNMSNNVYKTIELTGSSTKGMEDAVSTAIAKASTSVRNIDWFEVIETRGHVENGKVAHWQVTIKVGFRLED